MRPGCGNRPAMRSPMRCAIPEPSCGRLEPLISRGVRWPWPFKWVGKLLGEPFRCREMATRYAARRSCEAVGRNRLPSVLVRNPQERAFAMGVYGLGHRSQGIPARADARALRRSIWASEYSIHCQVGGHPRYAAAYVLPEHLRIGRFSHQVILAEGWVDLGQHLVAMWRSRGDSARGPFDEGRTGEHVS